MAFTNPYPAPTPEQIEIVKATVPALEAHGVTITSLFYKNMHRDIPALHEIFNQANQRNGLQPRALAMAVLAYAKYIDNLAVLGEAVEIICQKHASLYITPAQYDIVGTYLIAAIKEVLGDAGTEEILSAWGAAYWQLAYIMINREEELYAQRENRDWREFTVDRKVKESEEVTSFYFKPADGRPIDPHQPGQYISVKVAVAHQEWKQSRQYSLSTSRQQDTYRISVRRDPGIDKSDPSLQAHPGWVSNVLHDTIKEGDKVELSFPCGSFVLDPAKTPDAPLVLISGGVGVTPLMSMLDTLVDNGSERPLTWIHATRSQSAYPFGEHVKAIMQTKPEWHGIVFNKQQPATEVIGDNDYKILGGRISLQTLDPEADLHLNNPDTQYFICGPDAFMIELKEKLVALGANGDNVKYERFGTGDVIKPAEIRKALATQPAEKEGEGCPFSKMKAGQESSGLTCPVSGATNGAV